MVPGYDQRPARTGLAGLTKPDPKDRSAQIIAWAICWPWNLVWTICVYNPFRYVAEFLLKEIQSALFEISNGQFSSIEQDLTLDPLPPPYPIPERQPIPASQPRSTESATAVSIEVANVAAQPSTAESPTVAETAPEERPVVGSISDQSVTIETATTAAVEKTSPTNNENVRPEASPLINQSVSAEASPDDSIDDLPEHDLPEELEADLAEGGSSDSYTWTPPPPTSFVPLSNQPLRAVKYETGSVVPSKPEQATTPPKPAGDPWLEKHVPNQ